MENKDDNDSDVYPTILIVDDQDKKSFHEEIMFLIKRKHLFDILIPILDNANSIWNLCDNYGNTLLHIAAQYDHYELINYLIKHGSKADDQNNEGKTPLIIAIENRYLISTEILLEADGDIFLSDNSGKSALHWFHFNQWYDYMCLVWVILKRVETQCLSDSEVIAKKLLVAGWMPHNVILLKNTGVTKKMLDHGYHVNSHEPYNDHTVLHKAVLTHDTEHVKFLLNYNANPNLTDRFKRTPLHYVYDREGDFSEERLEIMKMLIDRGASLITTFDDSSWISQVDNTLKFGDREAIEILLLVNFDLSRKDKEGNTPLHTLASNKNPDVFKALEGYSFDVDCRNDIYQTPLIIAASYGNASIIQFLLDRGADINAVAFNNISPLYKCINNFSVKFETDQYEDCIQLLLEHGADVELTASTELPSVFSVVQKFNKYEVGELLVAHVALQKASGKRIDEFSYYKISSHLPFNNYYKLCKQQLSVKLYNSVTLLDLLSESDIKFECHARNQELTSSIQRFTEEWQTKLRYFITILQKRYSKAVKLLKLKKEVTCHLCEIMKIDYYQHPLIVDQILSYLDEQDLLNFLQVPLE